MTDTNQTQEIFKWNHCLIYRNCEAKVNEFFGADGADELIVQCGGAPGCMLTEVYVRNPEPHEMACKVIGSVCAANTVAKKS